MSCVIALFCTSMMFCFSNNSSVYLDIQPSNNVISNENINLENKVSNNLEEAQEKSQEKPEWKIEVPRIELSAQITEGTSDEILNSFVGHFEDTDLYDGNIGLAAHNRGYNVNYFEKIKELETGDEIIYKYNGNTRKYIVKEHQIIKETDWSYLEKTEDNRITLITCVEDMPEYRRCIQALEYKEE